MTLRARVARVVRAAVGELHWTPPGWVRRFGRFFAALDGVRRARPGLFYGIATAVVLAIGGGVALERWIASWPEPEYLQITVVDPPATPVRAPSAPPADPYP